MSCKVKFILCCICNFAASKVAPIATASSEFLIKKAAGQIITITSQKKHFPYHRRLTAVSPDYQHFLIDDILYSVTGERKKIIFPV